MKAKTLLLLPIVLLMACTKSTDEPINNAKAKYNILFKGESPYLEWYSNAGESFLSCDMKLNGEQDGEITERANRTEDNTFTLKNGVKIRVHDEYKIQRNDQETSLELTRSTKVLSDNPKATRRITLDGNQDSVVNTYNYTLQTALPITLIRPENDPCNSIPMCYYDNFIIEWNADVQNENGVIVIAEWNGVTMHGPSQGVSLANVDLIDDSGLATLSTDLFENMPDGALVDLWLIRANIITVNGIDGEILLSDIVENSPDVIVDLLTEHPELGLQLQPFMFASGAVKQFPFFLIREL